MEGWTLFGHRTATIVGVAGDVKHRHLRGEASPVVYVPLTQCPDNSAYVVVKTSGNPLRVVGAVPDAVRAMDQEQPIHDLQTRRRGPPVGCCPAATAGDTSASAGKCAAAGARAGRIDRQSSIASRWNRNQPLRFRSPVWRCPAS